ncbi:hypothetical protein F53441_14737 [Fusarium austroafricanum]|uniref:Histone H2A n=1 Tax=Fusarium austroafricanum TaxID=2364996 RepID=A0A8H4N7Y7_9HYPO|nr:hypothetical protein F53441_14737 [Fusarium austroafricanum]
MISNQSVLPPPESERLGPYDSKHHLLREQDIEALRLYRNEPEGQFIGGAATGLSRSVSEFVNPWKQPLFHLLNEMALSYIEHFVLPHLEGDNIASIAENLFPDYNRAGRPISLDVGSYLHFTQPDKSPIPNFDMPYLSTRVREFLESRCKNKSKTFEDNVVNGVSRVLAYIFAEVFDLADNAASDEQRNKILPCDVRLVVLHDEEILHLVSFSRVFWEGGLSNGR